MYLTKKFENRIQRKVKILFYPKNKQAKKKTFFYVGMKHSLLLKDLLFLSLKMHPIIKLLYRLSSGNPYVNN